MVRHPSSPCHLFGCTKKARPPKSARPQQQNRYCHGHDYTLQLIRFVQLLKSQVASGTRSLICLEEGVRLPIATSFELLRVGHLLSTHRLPHVPPLTRCQHENLTESHQCRHESPVECRRCRQRSLVEPHLNSALHPLARRHLVAHHWYLPQPGALPPLVQWQGSPSRV